MSAGKADATAPGRIVGNLDCETDFAAFARASPSSGVLPQRVLTTIAGAATLLRAFARDGDRLWLPTTLEPTAMATVAGLPQPLLESRPLNELSRVDRILAWGETPEVENERARLRTPTKTPGWTKLVNLPLHELPWHLPIPAACRAAAVNDRAFCLELATKLGYQLPGARLVTTPNELAEHIEAGGSPAATPGGWVLKARFSAAGRWRYIQSPDRAIDQRRIERLFARHGALLFEPWMDRSADFGVAAAVTPGGWRSFGFHRQSVDSVGRFLGVEVAVGRQLPASWLDARERADFETALAGTAEALGQAEYSGPFGIDAWRYRRADGSVGFHPLGEINGRMTFGLIARALVDRLQIPLGLRPGARIRLRFGKPADSSHGVPTVPLLVPTRPTGTPPVHTQPIKPHPINTAIWLEIHPP